MYYGKATKKQQKGMPQFYFGHGLSYTTFEYTNASATATPTAYTDGNVQVTIKNTGNRLGAEVIQLYVSDHNTAVEMPVKELRGFQKVTLQPGESRDVSITIGGRAFQYWDEQHNGWTTSIGKRTMLIGNASDHLPLKATFTVTP